MKFKIGEVSKFLNIPIETLRYYEKRNIVKPEKDDENNYRYYNAWDMNFILECKRYLGFGFSLAEIEAIIHRDKLPDFTKRMKNKQEEYEQQLKYYQLLVEKQKKYVSSLENIQSNLNQCILIVRPESYYFIHRQNYDFISKVNLGKVFEVWLNHYPFVNVVSVFNKEALLNRNVNNDYEWGYGLEKDYHKALEVPVTEKVVHLEPAECVYTVVAAGGEGTFSSRLLDMAMNYIEINKLKLVGDAVGNLLTRLHETDGYKRYLEFYLPVKKVN